MDSCNTAPIPIIERPTADFVLACIYLFMSLVGCTSNLLSLFCLRKIKQKQLTNNADRILFGLIVSDITTCFIVMPYRVVLHLYKPKILMMCLIRRIFIYYLTAFTFWSSSMMISFIAINRYVKVRISRQFVHESQQSEQCCYFIFILIILNDNHLKSCSAS